MKHESMLRALHFCTTADFDPIFEALRVRIRKNVKHESCRKLDYLLNKTRINLFRVLD